MYGQLLERLEYNPVISSEHYTPSQETPSIIEQGTDIGKLSLTGVKQFMGVYKCRLVK
jgi:hypothetical protein